MSPVCNNPNAAPEQDVLAQPSSQACAGCASEKLAPFEKTDFLIREECDPMLHGHHTAASVEPNAKTSTALGKPSTIREFERSLRTLGYSQREAKAIAMGGFGALRSDAGELSQIVEKLEELADIFRKQ